MSSTNHILTSFSSIAGFELIVGLNGFIWIKADSIKATHYLCDIIRSSDGISPLRQQALIKRYLQNYKSSAS
jgi:exosome complex RNA-binding protein Rrp4